MAVSQDTAEFQIVPSDSSLSRTHSRPHYARDPSSSTPSYAVSPDSRATIIEVRNKTTACGPLPVMEESGEGGLSSSGAMSASLPTPSDVATSSTGDKQELGLSSARMKRRESRKSKTRGPREVNQKPSLGASVREGELAAHNAQQAGDAAVVGGGGEVVVELVKSGNAAGKKRLQKKKAASREDPAPPQQEEDIDGGAQSHQLVMHLAVIACIRTYVRIHTHTHAHTHLCTNMHTCTVLLCAWVSDIYSNPCGAVFRKLSIQCVFGPVGYCATVL